MVEPSNQSSLGARFRAAGWEEKPLQVAGAINTYTACLAEATVFRSLYLSGAVAGKFAVRAGPGHQHHGRCAG
jgi:2-methylisocitrate lyase-like PEP mutase family enzyme